MKINPVVYGCTDFYKTAVFRVLNEQKVPVRTLTNEDLENSNFLCLTKGGDTFVSSMDYDDELGWYVDDTKRRRIVTIRELEELHLISFVRQRNNAHVE